MNKEAVYDAEIFPLMEKIIAICREHKIAMIASFALPSPEDAGLRCTTALLSNQQLEGVACKEDYLSALSMIQDGLVAYTVRVK